MKMNKPRVAFLFLVVALAGAAAVTDSLVHAAGETAKSAPTAESANKRKPSAANSFNRLFRGAASFNLPPHLDGIHDPDDVGTLSLQPPKEAFADLPKSRSGNRVDWVQALHDGLIAPRADQLDPDKKMTVLDLNIIREVKGTMPDVVYPHKQHTEWLDCRNCHPAIFVPKKGGNNISMAAILAGQYCGVCHGKVAFPVSECRLCHSKPKTPEELERRKKRQIATYQSSAKNAAKPPAVKQEPVQVTKLTESVSSSGNRADGGVRELSRKELMATGAEVYADFCAGCHGENGEGVPDTFPGLKGSKLVSGPVDAHLAIVLDGKVDTAMQAWREDLTPEEVAAVVTFERNAWGNHAGDVVQPAQVRSALNEPKQPDAGSAADDGETSATMDKADLVARGRIVYEENCAGCHGENGEGVPETFPPLKGSAIVSGTVNGHISIILNGKEETVMQAWGEDLSHSDIAAVITFQREMWGNGETVQPRDVAAAK